MGLLLSRPFRDIRRNLLIRRYLTEADMFFILLAGKREKLIVPERVVKQCISDSVRLEWLLLHTRVPFIKDLDILIASKGDVENLKLIEIRNAAKCSAQAIMHFNEPVMNFLLKKYNSVFTRELTYCSILFMTVRLGKWMTRVGIKY